MYCAYVTTLKGVQKHPNADRLNIVTVFGNNTIVDLSYHDGQRVIYFPVDGQLSEEFASDNNLLKKYVPVSELSMDEVKGKQIVNKEGIDCINIGGYMDSKKRNITALKLRGEQSDGLVLPLETLSKYVDIDTLKDGDTITVINGHEICRKYIPRQKYRNNNSSGKKGNAKELKEIVGFPLFIEHADTKQLAFNQSAFKEGDTCYITLKCHGTSQRTANTIEVTTRKRNKILKKLFNLKDKVTKRYKVITGTRRTTLRNYDGGYYGNNEFRMKYHDFFKEKLPKNIEVFYEVVGYVNGDKTIMGKCKNKLIKDKEFQKQYGDETVFSYGCNIGENDIYVYRMVMINEDGYMVELPWEQVQIEAEKMGVKCVPTFEKFIYTTWDDLMERVEKYYDGADPIGRTHIREGVVVRIDNRSSFTAFKHKNFNFKCLEGIIKDTSDAPDMEEAEELIVEEIS